MAQTPRIRLNGLIGKCRIPRQEYLRIRDLPVECSNLFYAYREKVAVIGFMVRGLQFANIECAVISVLFGKESTESYIVL